MSRTDGARLRAGAAQVVMAVAAQGRSLEDGLEATAATGLARPALQSLAYGTVRWFFELDGCLALLTDRPPERLDPLVRYLLLVGMYQLAHGLTPAHAAVAETVEAARALRRPRASGLVNAVLRRFQRERDALLAQAHREPQARHAHPSWLIEVIGRDWGERAEAILESGNRHPPMWLRVNARRMDLTTYRPRLAEAGLDASACGFAPEALRLDKPVDVRALPGFEEGDVSVQDAAAQLAPRLLAAGPGMRVLDACAAPGGKACHLLELQPELAELVAVDLDPGRAARIEDNLARLGLEARVRVGDATDPAAWWDGEPFDRILLDVPCSGTGVIRRHPDIKLLRRPADIPAFAERQQALLAATWPMLAPGGRLLYASCSVLRAENAQVVEAFLASRPEAVETTESARLFLPAPPPEPGRGPGLALPTGAADTDGFYYACLDKRA